MKDLGNLQQYFRERLVKDNERLRYPFLTISRQAGAGAHTLAREIIQQMERLPYADVFTNWNLFDVATYEGLAREPDLQASLETLAKEEYHSEVADLIIEVISNLPQQLVVYKKLFKIMRSLATMGKVILIGRGGSCVTRGIPGGIHVRLVAPEEIRVERIMKQRSVGKDAAADWMRERDHERSRLVRDFFSRDISDPLLYDVVWNTHTTPVTEIAAVTRRMIFKLVRERAAQNA